MRRISIFLFLVGLLPLSLSAQSAEDIEMYQMNSHKLSKMKLELMSEVIGLDEEKRATFAKLYSTLLSERTAHAITKLNLSSEAAKSNSSSVGELMRITNEFAVIEASILGDIEKCVGAKMFTTFYYYDLVGLEEKLGR